MADCGDVALAGIQIGGVLGAAAGVGAGTTALLTASSIAGGAIAGPVFTVLTVGAVGGLEIFGPFEEFGKGNDFHDITKIVLGILVGAAASFAAPSLLGFSITMGAVALVDASISAIVVGIFCLCGD